VPNCAFSKGKERRTRVLLWVNLDVFVGYFVLKSKLWIETFNMVGEEFKRDERKNGRRRGDEPLEVIGEVLRRRPTSNTTLAILKTEQPVGEHVERAGVDQWMGTAHVQSQERVGY